jgi:hypothetical protein
VLLKIEEKFVFVFLWWSYADSSYPQHDFLFVISLPVLSYFLFRYNRTAEVGTKRAIALAITAGFFW